MNNRKLLIIITLLMLCMGGLSSVLASSFLGDLESPKNTYEEPKEDETQLRQPAQGYHGGRPGVRYSREMQIIGDEQRRRPHEVLRNFFGFFGFDNIPEGRGLLIVIGYNRAQLQAQLYDHNNPLPNFRVAVYSSHVRRIHRFDNISVDNFIAGVQMAIDSWNSAFVRAGINIHIRIQEEDPNDQATVFHGNEVPEAYNRMGVGYVRLSIADEVPVDLHPEVDSQGRMASYTFARYQNMGHQIGELMIPHTMAHLVFGTVNSIAFFNNHVGIVLEPGFSEHMDIPHNYIGVHARLGVMLNNLTDSGHDITPAIALMVRPAIGQLFGLTFANHHVRSRPSSWDWMLGSSYYSLTLPVNANDHYRDDFMISSIAALGAESQGGILVAPNRLRLIDPRDEYIYELGRLMSNLLSPQVCPEEYIQACAAERSAKNEEEFYDIEELECEFVLSYCSKSIQIGANADFNRKFENQDMHLYTKDKEGNHTNHKLFASMKETGVIEEYKGDSVYYMPKEIEKFYVMMGDGHEYEINVNEVEGAVNLSAMLAYYRIYPDYEGVIGNVRYGRVHEELRRKEEAMQMND